MKRSFRVALATFALLGVIVGLSAAPVAAQQCPISNGDYPGDGAPPTDGVPGDGAPPTDGDYPNGDYWNGDYPDGFDSGGAIHVGDQWGGQQSPVHVGDYYEKHHYCNDDFWGHGHYYDAPWFNADIL